MKCLLFFLSITLLLSKVASLGIILQQQTIAGTPPSLVVWTRQDTDDLDFRFDLRFTQDDADVGLALANLKMGPDDQFGNATVTFPTEGNFVLKAVSGNTVIGVSNEVHVIPAIASSSSQAPASTTAPASVTGTTSTPAQPTAPTATSSTASPPTSASGSPTSNVPQASSNPAPPAGVLQGLRRHPNLPAIVGGVIGGLIILGILATVFVIVRRRRAAIQKRLTFHRDMMVQRRLSHADPSIPTVSPFLSVTPPEDVEQGLPSPVTVTSTVPRPLASGHIVPSPKGPRPSVKRTVTTIISPRPPLEPAPARTRRQQELADRISMLRGQMTELQNQPDTGHVVHVLDDMQRQMVWLRDHEQSPWALGLTDVLPPGHARYMTP